jgi:hypothetical protein
MINETVYKRNLLSKLNEINLGWVDGDKESGNEKKADIVNHTLKIAIEIKDDTKYKTVFPEKEGVMYTASHDLTKMNQRYADDIRSANSKFKNYPSYKTILILRTEFFVVDIIKYVILGLHTFSKVNDELVYSGRKGKYSSYVRNNIGCFLIVNHKLSFLPNRFAMQDRALNKEELEQMLSLEIEDIL